MADAAIEIQSKLMAAASARQRGELQEELRQLELALSLGPTNPVALNARGMRALADEQPEQAAQFLRGQRRPSHASQLCG